MFHNSNTLRAKSKTENVCQRKVRTYSVIFIRKCSSDPLVKVAENSGEAHNTLTARTALPADDVI